MIVRGNVTVIVSDIERAVQFYTATLGLKLGKRYAADYATVETAGLTIGLYPESKYHPAPGTQGAMLIGLEIDGAIEDAVARLKEKGVRFTAPIVTDARAGKFANFEDPDGNPLYLWENKWTA